MKKRIRRVLTVVFLLISVGSLGVVLYTKQQYRVSEDLYSRASVQYTSRTEEGTAETAEAPGEDPDTVSPPIQVDFDALLAENEDIVGWIYCEGTPIDYLVVQGTDNDYYLRRSYDGVHSMAGTIFIDANNQPGFADCNTIIYGHNMKNGSMFAVLSRWAEQEFYEEHPVIWFLTPRRNYQIVLLGGCTTSAYSDVYTIYPQSCEEFDCYVQDIMAASDFRSEAETEEGAHYAVLSTCSYVFDNARYILLGKLVPADSAEEDRSGEDGRQIQG